MSGKAILVTALVTASFLVAPAELAADYYDSFSDGSIWQDPNWNPNDDPNMYPDPPWDPNLWDPCNPHWGIAKLMGLNFIVDANDGELRLYVEKNPITPHGFLAVFVDDLDHDPNTSTAFFDNSGPHYILSRLRFNPGEPNDSGMMIMIHGDPATWNTYGIDYEAGDNDFMFEWISGTDFKPKHVTRLIDPEPDEANGFWMLLQYDPAGPTGTRDPNDPNNHWLRSAYWNGERSDWDGTWTIEAHILQEWNPSQYPYHSDGMCALASYGNTDTGPGLRGDVKFDNVEAKWGYFGQDWPTTLEMKLKDANAIYVYPNYPHPEGGAKRQYDKGTVVVCEATCNGTKSFKKWTIKGPNDEGDPLYQVVVDTNAVLYLTMDGDYLVKATCKCGGGGIEPFAATVLLVLGLTVVIRRLT